MQNANASELTEKLRALLTKQTRVIDLAIHALVTGEGVEKSDELRQQKEVVDVILMLMQGMGVSCHSLVKLTDPLDMAIRDCFGIARSICETGINVAYIVTGGVEKARRARQHALQKAYRDASRTGKLGGISFKLTVAGKLPEPDEIPELREALDAFTTRKGHELTDWTPDNIDARLKLIGEKFKGANVSLAGSFFSIYRHASEILHGSFFGVVHFWTSNGQPLRSREQAEQWFATNHFVAVFSAAFFACQGVIEVIEQQFGIPSLKAANSELLSETRTAILSFEAKNQEPATKDS